MRRAWKPRREDEYLVDLFLTLLERLSPEGRKKLEYVLKHWF